MNTLIELYDERPLENILGVEVFQPKRAVYVCPHSAASDQELHRKMRAYFRHRGVKPELIFMRAQIYDTEAMLVLFRKIVERYPDCALDITGGTDAVLFAAVILIGLMGMPAVRLLLPKSTGGMAQLEYGDGQRAVLSLDEPGIYDFESNGITVHIEVRDGTAAFVRSECPNHICEGYGRLGSDNETAVCLPAKAVLTIQEGSR